MSEKNENADHQNNVVSEIDELSDLKESVVLLAGYDENETFGSPNLKKKSERRYNIAVQ